MCQRQETWFSEMKTFKNPYRPKTHIPLVEVLCFSKSETKLGYEAFAKVISFCWRPRVSKHSFFMLHRMHMMYDWHSFSSS